MKFKAVNLKNEVIFGNGVTMASEKIEYWSDNVNVEENVKKYGEELAYLFNDTLEWVDGAEFNGINWDVVFANSVEMIKD